MCARILACLRIDFCAWWWQKRLYFPARRLHPVSGGWVDLSGTGTAALHRLRFNGWGAATLPPAAALFLGGGRAFKSCQCTVHAESYCVHHCYYQAGVLFHCVLQLQCGSTATVVVFTTHCSNDLSRHDSCHGVVCRQPYLVGSTCRVVLLLSE
jgi:hypothetical protein